MQFLLIGELLVKIGDFFLRLIKQSRTMKALEAPKDDFGTLERLEAIDELLERAVLETNCSRALLLGVSNGAEITENSDLYVTILDEKSETEIPNVERLYQKVHADDSYRNMLHALVKKKILTLSTEHLSKESLLKERYELDGIKQSIVALIFFDSLIFYTSFSTQNTYNQSDKVVLKTIARQFKKLMNKEVRDYFKKKMLN